MKKIVVLFLFYVASLSITWAQDLPVDPTTKKVTYWEVVEVPGASKDVLFKRAKSFGTAAPDKIIKNDEASGVYSTKGEMKVTYPSPMKGMNHEGIVEYTITIFAKEGRYKYVISDLMHKSVKGNGGEISRSIPECGKYTLVPAGWSAIKKSADEQAKAIIEGLKAGMKNPAKNSATSNDW
jgi:hypothetical protein